MLIAGLIILQIILMLIGRGSKDFRLRHYIIVALVTAAQMAIVAFYAFTAQVPSF